MRDKPVLPLSPPIFTILSSLVEERVGLAYSSADREIFESKASSRALDAGFESMLDYYYHLRYDDPEQTEFRAFVEALLVHETFFFREFEPLRVAIEQFIVPLCERGERPRIWCAACSTGEEPLTIAMLLHERGLLAKVELVASDISEQALARARSGTFSIRALRQHTGHPLAERYLRKQDKTLYAQPELLAAIDFRQINLTIADEVASLGSFDLIVCRNVLIYFRDDRTRQVVASLAGRLSGGGALLVGVSESLMRFATVLRCEEHRGTFLYRKGGSP